MRHSALTIFGAEACSACGRGGDSGVGKLYLISEAPTPMPDGPAVGKAECAVADG